MSIAAMATAIAIFHVISPITFPHVLPMRVKPLPLRQPTHVFEAFLFTGCHFAQPGSRFYALATSLTACPFLAGALRRTTSSGQVAEM